jgi:L-cystine uptake protein TcyP (sodium:dicarboxylate symporter family)
MFPQLNQSKIFLVSSIFCVPSSAIVQSSIFWILFWIPDRYIPPVQNMLITIVIGMITGLMKSFIVGAIAYLVKPSFRWLLILGSTIVLTVFEGYIYYNLWHASSPIFG